MFHPQLPELVDLCRAVPDTPVILDHLGGPLGIGPYAGRRDEVLAGWRQSMADVAACDNVVLKLGGIGMAIYGMRWHKTGGASAEQLAETWGEPIRWCIETFGPAALHVRVELPGRQGVVHVRRPLAGVRADRRRCQPRATATTSSPAPPPRAYRL